MSKQQDDAVRVAARKYQELGYTLVAWPSIHNGQYTKGPQFPGWGLSPAGDVPNGHSIGLNHGLSRTFALDGDDGAATLKIFEALGITPEDLAGLASLRSPAENRFKLVGRMPTAHNCGPRKLVVEGETIFELRAAVHGKQTQDVLPPSPHPDPDDRSRTDGPYEWETEPPRIDELATISPKLLDLWRNWDAHVPAMLKALGVKSAGPRRLASAGEFNDELVARYNEACDVEALLTHAGYTRHGAAWLHPDSTSGVPGLKQMPDGKWYSHAGDKLGDGQPHDAFDLSRILLHDGDWRAAREHAAELLDMELPDDEPEPTDLWTQPPVPAVDVSFYPPVIRDYAVAVARSTGLDAGFVALSCLTTAAAMLHAEATLSPYANGQTMTVSPVLWTMGLAASGAGKGEGMKPALTVLQDVQSALFRGRAEGDPPIAGHTVSDATTEGWMTALQHNDSYPLAVFPEAKVLLEFGRYSTAGSATAERAFWNMLYDTERDRVRARSKSHQVVKYFGASMLGATTVDQIEGDILDAGKDGFFPRTHVYFLRPSGHGDDSSFEAEQLAFWQLLATLRMSKPVKVKVSQDATDVYASWWRDHVAPLASMLVEAQPGFGAFVRRLSNKAARFMLVDAWARAAMSHRPASVGAERTLNIQPVVDATAAHRAIAFARHMFQHGETFYEQKLQGTVGELATKIALHILAHECETVGTRDFLRHRLNLWGNVDEKTQQRAIRRLGDAGWLVSGHATRQNKVHPKLEWNNSWVVNPLVHQKYKDRAAAERARRAAIQASLLEARGR